MQRLRVLYQQAPPLSLALRWLGGLGLVLALVATFTELAEDVWFHEGFAWDAPLILALHQLSRPWLDTAMRIVTQTGEGGAIALALALAGGLLWHRQRLAAATVVISFAGAVAINTVLKLLLARPRPALFPPLVAASGFSFPSGHVTAAVAVYGLLAVFLWRQRHRAWAIVSGAWVFVVAVSRIYLGVHYPSDTLGSLAFATLWLMVVFAGCAWYARRGTQASGATGGHKGLSQGDLFSRIRNLTFGALAR
jgi:undecaprenyl-diphosphatase